MKVEVAIKQIPGVAILKEFRELMMNLSRTTANSTEIHSLSRFVLPVVYTVLQGAYEESV